MNSSVKIRRTAACAGVVLAIALVTAFALPAQAATVAGKASELYDHMCQRFCGHHHHHHGHEWCDGHEHFWCRGHR